MHKTLWTDLGAGDADRRRASSTTSTPRRATSPARSSGWSTRALSRERDRGLLPDERAVAGAGGHARAARDRLPGDRRHEVLRARRDQGRDRLPDAARQPAGRGQLPRASPTRPRRGIGQTSLSRVLTHADDDRASASGTRPPTPASVPGLGAAAIKALGRFMDDDGGPARARRAAGRRSATCSRPCCTRPATSTGSRPSARSRRRAGSRTSQELVEVAREFDAARARGARTRSTCSCSRSRSSPTPTRAQRRRGPRHADDAAQRQGPRVPGRLHDRLRGGRLPALALARRGQPRGGAPPLLRRRSPARCATSR